MSRFTFFTYVSVFTTEMTVAYVALRVTHIPIPIRLTAIQTHSCCRITHRPQIVAFVFTRNTFFILHIHSILAFVTDSRRVVCHMAANTRGVKAGTPI